MKVSYLYFHFRYTMRKYTNTKVHDRDLVCLLLNTRHEVYDILNIYIYNEYMYIYFQNNT